MQALTNPHRSFCCCCFSSCLLCLFLFLLSHTPPVTFSPGWCDQTIRPPPDPRKAVAKINELWTLPDPLHRRLETETDEEPTPALEAREMGGRWGGRDMGGRWGTQLTQWLSSMVHHDLFGCSGRWEPRGSSENQSL